MTQLSMAGRSPKRSAAGRKAPGVMSSVAAPLAPAVLEVPDELLLLGVDRDHRLTGADRRRSGRVDIAELGVAIGMRGALLGLAVGLQAVAQ